MLVAHSAFAQSMSIKQSELLSEENATGTIRAIRTEIAYLAKQKGKLVEIQRVLRSITIYDPKGNRTETLEFHEGAVSQKVIYTHDASGRKTAETLYRPEGSLHHRTIYVPYTLPHSVEALTYDASGTLLQERLIYLYGADGKLIKLIQDNGKDDEVMRDPIWIVFGYDIKGRRREEIHCSGNATSRNDDFGLPNANNPCGGGKFSGKNFSFYDEKGLLIREDLNSVNSYLKYEYEYDSKGNWTKRITLEKRTENHREYYVPSSVTYRSFTYY